MHSNSRNQTRIQFSKEKLTAPLKNYFKTVD